MRVKTNTKTKHLVDGKAIVAAQGGSRLSAPRVAILIQEQASDPHSGEETLATLGLGLEEAEAFARRILAAVEEAKAL